MWKKISPATRRKRKGLVRQIRPVTAIAILFLIIISGVVIYSFFADNSANVQERIVRARTENEVSFDKMRNDQIAALMKAGAITTDNPEYSSKVDACYVTHSDSGWVANNWYQDCYIRYVDLFSTKLTQADIRQKLHESGDGLFGKPYMFQPRECGKIYEQDSDPSLLYLNWKVPENIAASYDCKVPRPTQGVFTVKGPIVLDKDLQFKVERLFDVNEVDKDKQYIGLQSDHHYYHESLGCGFGVACPSPREKAITGF